ncbi:hypothetical protein GN956_G21869 [Arapaima gigas]
MASLGTVWFSKCKTGARTPARQGCSIQCILWKRRNTQVWLVRGGHKSALPPAHIHTQPTIQVSVTLEGETLHTKPAKHIARGPQMLPATSTRASRGSAAGPPQPGTVNTAPPASPAGPNPPLSAAATNRERSRDLLMAAQ